MDRKLKEHIDEFIDEFLSFPEVKQFLLIKEQIESSKEMIELRNNLKQAQKNMALSLGTSSYEENKKIYFKIKEEYDNHPLIINYNYLKEDVDYLLNEIKELIK